MGTGATDMTDSTQSKALRMALDLEALDLDDIAAELRRQHARIADLEAQLSAIGTGCKVVLRFSNTDEAEVWFGALATRRAAPVAQGDAWLRKGWKVEPLYVAPPAVVEPLTVQQIWASDEIMSANAMPMDDLLRIVRAVEAAHGIGIGIKKGSLHD